MAHTPSWSRHRFGGSPPGEDTAAQERGKTAARGGRYPAPPFYLESPPAVIPIDVGRQLLVDDFLVEHTDLRHTFDAPSTPADGAGRAERRPPSRLAGTGSRWQLRGRRAGTRGGRFPRPGRQRRWHRACVLVRRRTRPARPDELAAGTRDGGCEP